MSNISQDDFGSVAGAEPGFVIVAYHKPDAPGFEEELKEILRAKAQNITGYYGWDSDRGIQSLGFKDTDFQHFIDFHTSANRPKTTHIEPVQILDIRFRRLHAFTERDYELANKRASKTWDITVRDNPYDLYMLVELAQVRRIAMPAIVLSTSKLARNKKRPGTKAGQKFRWVWENTRGKGEEPRAG